MENKIRIENPCSENWNAMSANTKGRFCNSCSKTVVDFTKMKHPEIEKYFTDNATTEKNICGYYAFDQVETDNTYSRIRARFNRIKVRPVKFAALLALSMLFSFSSCFMGKRAEEQPEDVIENDSIREKDDNGKLQNAVPVKDTLKTESDSLKGKRN